MAAKTGKKHVWRQTTVKGKLVSWCERCGMDKPTDAIDAHRADCRPTSFPGFGE
jgi:hypothetical protein